jgi:hypothetical protein
MLLKTAMSRLIMRTLALSRYTVITMGVIHLHHNQFKANFKKLVSQDTKIILTGHKNISKCLVLSEQLTSDI